MMKSHRAFFIYRRILNEQYRNQPHRQQHPCPTVRKQIGKTTYIVRVHFSETAKETMEDKIKRLLREEVRRM